MEYAQDVLVVLIALFVVGGQLGAIAGFLIDETTAGDDGDPSGGQSIAVISEVPKCGGSTS